MHTLRSGPCSTPHPDENADEDEQQDQNDGGDHAADAGIGHRFFGGAGSGGHGVSVLVLGTLKRTLVRWKVMGKRQISWLDLSAPLRAEPTALPENTTAIVAEMRTACIRTVY